MVTGFLVAVVDGKDDGVRDPQILKSGKFIIQRTEQMSSLIWQCLKNVVVDLTMCFPVNEDLNFRN